MRTVNDALNQARSKAIAILKDRKKLLRLLETASRRIAGGVTPLDARGVSGKLQAAVRMIRSAVRREYPHIPWQSLVLITAGIVYFVSPADALPDFIPLLGFTDDAAILAAILASISGDLERFIEWEKSQAGHINLTITPTIVDAEIDETRE